MKRELVVTVVLVSLIMAPVAPSVSAQFEPGGVNHPGTWWVGEGLKVGDYFSYKLCHFNYKECTDFQMDFWIEGDRTVGTEEKWLAKVVVYEGNKIVKGEMELGKFAPEPSGGSAELSQYRGAFKSSIVWLSAFATEEIGVAGKGPKKFSQPSWGKIANIGGQQIRPVAIESLNTPYQNFDETIRVEWKTGGATSKVWVVDDFPFPVKAITWVHVSEGIPPREYQFELLNYRENITTDPFEGIISTEKKPEQAGCPQNYKLTSITKTTKDFQYIVDLKYGPPNPVQGCNIEWLIEFKNKFDETEFLNEVQFDILVLDENQKPIRSVAQEEGQRFFYSPSGQVRTFTSVEENPGTAHYAIWIYGTSPKTVVPPSSEQDFLPIDIQIEGKAPSTAPGLNIPSWIKNNAGWWSSGQIGDSDFVSGIQYLINQGIMNIPPTTPGTDTGIQEIPSWIKNNAGWWAEGSISDTDFVSGIQWLISNGIMKIG